MIISQDYVLDNSYIAVKCDILYIIALKPFDYIDQKTRLKIIVLKQLLHIKIRYTTLLLKIEMLLNLFKDSD